MKEIPLTREKVMLVSDCDFERSVSHSWGFHIQGYAKGCVRGKHVLFHRWLLEAKEGQEVDHVNGDKLDNRRENLRLCTSSQNKANNENQSNNTSGYKGIDFRRDKKRFRVRVAKKFIGYYKTIEDAVSAYNETAERVFGEFSRPNKIT